MRGHLDTFETNERSSVGKFNLLRLGFGRFFSLQAAGALRHLLKDALNNQIWVESFLYRANKDYNVIFSGENIRVKLNYFRQLLNVFFTIQTFQFTTKHKCNQFPQ